MNEWLTDLRDSQVYPGRRLMDNNEDCDMSPPNTCRDETGAYNVNGKLIFEGVPMCDGALPGRAGEMWASSFQA